MPMPVDVFAERTKRIRAWVTGHAVETQALSDDLAWWSAYFDTKEADHG